MFPTLSQGRILVVMLMSAEMVKLKQWEKSGLFLVIRVLYLIDIGI